MTLHDGFGRAKGAAYSFILFLFPLLLFLVTCLLVTNVIEMVMPQMMRLVAGIFPPESSPLVVSFIKQLVASEPTNLLVGAFIVMVWAGSGMMVTFIEGLDEAYQVTNSRSMVRQRVVAIGLVLLAGVPLVSLTLLIILFGYLRQVVEAQLGLTISWMWRLVGWGFVLGSSLTLIGMIYFVGPHRRQTWTGVFPGAGLAAILWVAVTLGFHEYVSRFGDYDVLYGSLGAGIILLVWMYLSSLVVLFGGEFNAALESGARSPHSAISIDCRSEDTHPDH